MRKQEDASACSRCNYDRRETEAEGQREPKPPGAAGPQPRRPRNTRRIGSGLLVRGLFETARGVVPHPKRDCPIQVLGGAHDYARRREPRLGATLRRHLRDHQSLYLKYSCERFAFRMLLRRQSQPDGTHSAPTYWLRERRRGSRSVRLLRRIGGIKPPSQSGHVNAQLTFAHSSHTAQQLRSAALCKHPKPVATEDCSPERSSLRRKQTTVRIVGCACSAGSRVRYPGDDRRRQTGERFFLELALSCSPDAMRRGIERRLIPASGLVRSARRRAKRRR